MFNSIIKSFFSSIFACFIIFGGVFFTVASSALAADISHGKMIFTSNCAACHSGGLNAVVQQKTLKADALKTYEKDSIEAIVNQVANGQGAMPKFANLSEEDKIDVAAYVLDQAKKEWK